MFKKIFFLLSFTLFVTFPVSPILAETVSTATTPTQDTSVSWWDSIINSISNVFNRLIETPDTKPIQINEKISENLNYDSPNFDSTTRAISTKDQEIAKGVYFYQLIHDPDGYEDVSYYPSQDCGQIKISQMLYYYYTIKQKILRDLNKNLVDYDPNIMEKYKTDLNLPSICYTTVYDRISNVPQGKFRGKDNAAPAVSTQLNNNFDNFIPIAYQNDNIPNNNVDANDAKTIIESSDKKELSNIQWATPQSQQSYLATLDRDGAREVDAYQKQPWIWNGDLQERDENSPVNGGEDTSFIGDNNNNVAIDGRGSSNGKCNAYGSHCRGMSQYGVYGMAKSGKNYLDILKFYYGDIAIKTINVNSYVKVKFDKSDDACSAGKIRAYKIEEYLLGLGEMPNDWGIKGLEALKAQIVAARTYSYVRTKAFANPICNTTYCQVFRCTNLTSTKRKFIAKAIEETAGQIIVDASNQTTFSTEYARSFCGASKSVVFPKHTTPSVNAAENIKYEKIGHPSTLYCKSNVSNI